MDFKPSSRTTDYLERIRQFMREHIHPIEPRYWAQVRASHPDGDWRKWKIHPEVERLKALARAQGLWNLFLPDARLGAGLSTLEYAPLAEEMGRSFLAPEVFNCSAPDTGNMEVLWRYGSEEQKRRWLTPLLAGEIRSVFCMTEPDVASSDATNMQATAVIEGDEVVLNGKKWWSSGLGDPRAKIAIFMARTPDAGNDRHRQHSMVLVPLDTPGVEIQRMLPVFGELRRAPRPRRGALQPGARAARSTSSRARAGASRSPRAASVPAASTTACAASAPPSARSS